MPPVTKLNVCSQCSQSFVVKDLHHPRGSRCPILLHCGHSVCELCLRNHMKPKTGMNCLICGIATIPKSEKLTEIIEEFSPHMYLVGHMTISHSSRLPVDVKLNFLPAGASANTGFFLTNRKKATISSNQLEVCEECNNQTAIWHCEKCMENFCQMCWTKTHSMTKGLRKHVSMPIAKSKNTNNVLKQCPVHDTQMLEFYCKICDVVICSHCLLLSHQGSGHCPITLKEKNEERALAVEAAAEELESTVQRMRHTLKKVRMERMNMTKNPTKLISVEQQITRNFARLHGALQIIEEELLEKVEEARTKQEKSLEDIQTNLESKIEFLVSLLEEYRESMTPTNMNSINLTNLCNRLLDNKDLPCFLVSPDKGFPELRPKVQFDDFDNLLDAFSNYCKLEIPPVSVFELKSSKDLPENYAIEPITPEPTSKLKLTNITKNELSLHIAHKTPDVTSNVGAGGTISRTSSSNSVNSFSQSEPKPRKSLLVEGAALTVSVCYVNNPGEFYVIFRSDRGKQNLLEKKARDHALSNSMMPTSVAKDQIYICQYKDKKWYRARVVKVVSPEEAKERPNILVCYIDYGNREFVYINRLRCIPDSLREEPALAIRCRLFGCMPKNAEWTKESRECMADLLKDAIVTMYIMKVHPDCLEVDLSKTSRDEHIGNDILSVRDTMIFLEHASFVAGVQKKTPNVNVIDYLQQTLPNEGDQFSVVLSFIVTPHHFYVQKFGAESDYLLRMMDEMDRYYSDFNEKGMIYNPVVGMACAAQFSADRKWYRAKIVNLPGSKMIQVQYVDYGNQETIPYTSIRRLNERFFKLVPQALKCSLADIKPINAATGWTKDAKFHFQKRCSQKNLLLIVRSKDKGWIRVHLYDVRDDKDTLINATFIYKNLAVSAGINIQQAVACKSDAASDNSDCGTRINKSKNQLPSVKAAKNKRLVAEELRAEDSAEKMDSEESNDEKDAPNSGSYQTEVEILALHSPSLLYVSVVAFSDELQKLQKDLKRFYKDSSPKENSAWKIDDKCAAYSLEKRKWFRAVIHEFINSERVKVFFKDFAQVEEVPINYLRELDKKFLDVPVGAVKCHLANVKPPGGEWPSISCEFLETEIEKYSHLYMTKMGDIENMSLPIELWVKRITPGGALEPTIEDWITLNQLLVEQGLAIPEKSNELTTRSEFLLTERLGIDSVDENEKKVWRSRKTKRTDSFGRDEDEEDEGGGSVADVESVCSENDSKTFIPSVLSDWLEPKPLTKTEFVGIPTYVDSKGIIYMYDLDEDDAVLERIKKSLSKVYDGSKPTPHDHFWSPGQLCVVRYHVDGLWYRGKVLKCNPDLTYDVLFVDYGNIESCQIVDMRKSIKTAHIPIITHKFQLQGISPITEDGTWPEESADYFHTLIVDKKCFVKVLDTSYDANEPSKIQLFLQPRNENVASVLVGSNHAVYVSTDTDDSVIAESDDIILNDRTEELEMETSAGIKPEIGEQEAEEDSKIIDWCTIVEEEIKKEKLMKKSAAASAHLEALESKNAAINQLTFKDLEIPLECKSFPVEAIMITQTVEFLGNLLDDENLPKHLRMTIKEFENLTSELQEKAAEQPLLENFETGTPCLGLYSENSEWYRAEIGGIHPEDENLAEVIYVDYGNKEFIPKENIRVCHGDCFKLPKMLLKFRLFNVEKTPKTPRNAYKKALQKCLFEVDLLVNIAVRHEGCFEVDVLQPGTDTLVYKSMIDEGLMRYVIDPDDSE